MVAIGCSLTLMKPAWRFAEPLLERPCRVLFAGPHFQASYPLTKQVLKERGHSKDAIELVHAPTPQDVHRLAPTAHCAIPFMERFPKSFFEQCQEKLRLVVQFGVGLEGVDMKTATEMGIAVSNIPADGTGNAQATSEHALFLTISLLRHLDDLKRRFQQRELGGLPIPRTLFGKRVTVVGYGSVGKILCHYLVTMGAEVQVVRNRCWSQEEQDAPPWHNAPNFEKAASLQAALPMTDVLILACLMTPETFHLINEKSLSLLPRGALVVNVGRGHLVEYETMLSAIQSGHVGGFASDVGVGHSTKPSEPWDPEDELSKHPNCVFTPHVGGYTDYAYSVMSNKVVDAVECAIDGKPPPVWVNNELEYAN